MVDFITSLRTTAWRTAGARYNAARRLKQRETFSTFSLALLSAMSVAAAVAQKIYAPDSNTQLDNYLTVVSVALGVVLLAISLLEWGAANGAKADGLHRNAEELTSYQLKLAQVIAQVIGGRVLSDTEIDVLRKEYEAIKRVCPYNHSPRDHDYFIAQHRTAPEFTDAATGSQLSFWGAVRIRVGWHWSTLWFFGAVWLFAAAAFAYAGFVIKG